MRRSIKFPQASHSDDTLYHNVCHGLLVERHGLDLAVRALALLRNRIPQMKFDIYGEPTDYIEKVLGLVRELGMEEIVQYHGFKPFNQVPSLISSIDLGLVPNRLNPFTKINLPTRIFEYLAMDKPVIVPRTPGVEDYFSDDSIIYYRAGEIEDLAQKIEWAWSHPTELRAVMERGREIYRRNSWKTEQERFMTAVNGMLQDRDSDTVHHHNQRSNNTLPFHNGKLAQGLEGRQELEPQQFSANYEGSTSVKVPSQKQSCKTFWRRYAKAKDLGGFG